MPLAMNALFLITDNAMVLSRLKNLCIITSLCLVMAVIEKLCITN